MDIQFYGANAFVLSNKHTRIVIDDNLADLGAKSITKAGDIAIFTGAHGAPAVETKLILDQPGEYEVSDVSVYGIQLRSHMDEDKQKNAVAYKLIFDDIRLLVAGHIHPDLSDRQLEAIGTVDVLVVPVGGNGYTLDPVGAAKLIKNIEPKLVIPAHFDDGSLAFPVPQQPLAAALTTLGIEPNQTTEKLRLKASDLAEATELIVLERAK